MSLIGLCLAVVIYLRVSSKKQAAPNKVSIEEQLAKCKQLCEQQGLKVVATFVDKDKYKKTKAPFKGKFVEPSGKWDDRPGFVEMIERVEQGDIDAIVNFDITRIGRHLRVLGTLANSLDIANSKRRSEVQIWEASKNSTVTRMMLGIMITMAQEENETRVHRVRMGKVGRLKKGYWPGPYQRLGYKLVKDEFGSKIEFELEELKIVQLIYDLADRGYSTYKIRRKLVAIGAKQKGHRSRLRDWSEAMITSILRCPDYMGEAVWKFDDGEEYRIKIPQAIKPEQWHRVQRGIEERKTKSLRNTKVTWAALQHILVCGECGEKMYLSAKRFYHRKIDGQKIRCEYQIPLYSYRCGKARRHPHTHTKNSLSGPGIDYKIWRYLVDNAVKNPDLIKERVEARQQELMEQGNSVVSEIARAERELKQIEAGRNLLMEQLTKGVIDKQDFELIMTQRNRDRAYWQEEMTRLKTLRDEHEIVSQGLELAYQYLAAIDERLPELDISPKEFKRLPVERQVEILHERKNIIQSICEHVIVYNDGQIEIGGLIGEQSQLFRGNQSRP